MLAQGPSTQIVTILPTSAGRWVCISMLVVQVVIHVIHSFIHSQAFLFFNHQADSLLQAEEELGSWQEGVIHPVTLPHPD